MSRWVQLAVDEMVGGIAQLLGELPPELPNLGQHVAERDVDDWG